MENEVKQNTITTAEVGPSEQTNTVEIKPDDGVIVLKNVTKRFGNNIVLDDISLAIEKGKTTVVIGPSGCGKSVLLKHMIVLMRPTAGEVFFKGRRIDNLDEKDLNGIRAHFGYLFQAGALFDSLSVAENIMFPVRQHCQVTRWSAVEELVRNKLKMVGLDGLQQFYPANLSGG